MVAIRNGIGITRSTLGNGRQDAYQAGQPIGVGRDVPYTNPYLAQVSTLTFAATADVSDEIVAGQVWTITLTDPDGVEYETLYTVTADDNTAGTDGAGLALIASNLAAAMESNPELDNLVDASSSGAVITVTWKHADQGAWTITAVCTPAAAEAVLVATPATPQTAGGSTIPMARFVAYGSPVPDGPGGPGRRAILPTSATSRIAGIALTDYLAVRPFDTTASAVNAYAIGAIVNVREEGEVAMVNNGSAAAVAGDPVYCVVSTTGGDALGEARSTGSGVAQVVTATPTAVNSAVYGLQIEIPAFGTLPAMVRTFEFTADGSATATEINDGFRTAMAADAAFTARIVASGAATLILTGQYQGMAFTVSDVAEAGDWASITTTTAAASYAVLVPGARWTIPTAVGAIGRVFVRQTLHS